MNIGQFEESLCRSTQSERERNWVRARVFEAMGDKFFWHGDIKAARKLYLLGLQKDWRMLKALLKLLLLSLGKPGSYVRRLILSFHSMPPSVLSTGR
jgi:predicted negative regulator of RcsB-dependent stress response